MVDTSTKPRAVFSYDQWITEQAAIVEAAIRKLGRTGIYDGAVWVVPSNGAEPGRLIIGEEIPAGMGMLECLAFPRVGTRVSGIPYSHIRSLLWEACRRSPICPTA